MERGDKLELDIILSLIRQGRTPSQISKKYNIPKSSLAYHVGILKAKGCIKKKGYGVWEYVKPLKKFENGPIDTKKGQIGTSKEIRGHAFIWKILLPETIDWKILLDKAKINYQIIGKGKVFRIIFEHRKIWLTKKGIIIYEGMDFLGKSSFEVKGTAVYEMDQVIKKLFKKLGLSDPRYKFTTSREHYGLIKNELARQYNEKKEKMAIISEDGTIWLWIDDSLSLGELETNNPLISRQVQEFWNDQKKTGFKVTPTFIMNGMAKTNEAILRNTEHLEFHAENMRSHVGAVRDLRVGVNTLSEKIIELAEIIKDLKKKD